MQYSTGGGVFVGQADECGVEDMLGLRGLGTEPAALGFRAKAVEGESGT